MDGDGRMQVARAVSEAEGGNAEAECRRARQLQFAHVLARAASVQNTTCANACPKDFLIDELRNNRPPRLAGEAEEWTHNTQTQRGVTLTSRGICVSKVYIDSLQPQLCGCRA